MKFLGSPIGSRGMPLVALLSALFGFVVASAALAAPTAPEAPPIDWLQLNMGLFGGLALFLGGLEVLSQGLKNAAGNTQATEALRRSPGRHRR